MDQSETGVMLKIRVLNCSKKELFKDLQRAPEFDQSALFKKVYEEEYGVFGGAPFGALVGDYEFGKHPEDIELLEKDLPRGGGGACSVPGGGGARICSTCRASRPSMRRATWRRSSTPPNTPSGRASASPRIPVTWRCAFRAYLGRLPYGKDTKPVEDFNYEEHVDGTDHSKYLWMNAAYRAGIRG